MSPEPARTPKLQWQSSTVVAIEPRTPTVKSFFFRLPQPLNFVPGQHMDVRLTAPDGYQAQRSYSIASAPEETDRYELAIELLQDGEVSPFFFNTVAVGDEIELRGPIGGHFRWSVADDGPLLLVGGGSGVVPLACMSGSRGRGAECGSPSSTPHALPRISFSTTSCMPCIRVGPASTSFLRSHATRTQPRDGASAASIRRCSQIRWLCCNPLRNWYSSVVPTRLSRPLLMHSFHWESRHRRFERNVTAVKYHATLNPEPWIRGRNHRTAKMPSTTKASSTTPCAMANGGSFCVGASSLRNGTFRNACTTATNTLR